MRKSAITDKIKDSASYIVSTEILNQTKDFTPYEIIEAMQTKLEPILGDRENTESFVKNKINALCECGLISGTGIIYYVLS